MPQAQRTYIQVRSDVRISSCKTDELAGQFGTGFCPETENAQIINDELIILAEEYIKFGGLPKIVLESKEEKKHVYLSQIINTYIRKDIRDIGNIRNISLFNKLLEVLASQSGQILNISELSNAAGINRETVLQYLDLLENTFIIRRIAPFHKNLRSELFKNPKVFMLDTGIMHLLWLKEFPKIIFGNVFETFVFLELMKKSDRINFWRTTNKQEVDFILNRKEIYAVEAKLNFQNADTNSLVFFGKMYNCKKVVVGLKGEKKGKKPHKNGRLKKKQLSNMQKKATLMKICSSSQLGQKRLKRLLKKPKRLRKEK